MEVRRPKIMVEKANRVRIGILDSKAQTGIIFCGLKNGESTNDQGPQFSHLY